jgi:beta-galactosidase/beta-glucuronidase
MVAPRPEYPRPQYVRDEWMNLNGVWAFDFDDKNVGMAHGWYSKHDYSRVIKVPFAFESDLSGIGDHSFHDIVWYEREFDVPQHWENKRIILHFGAVDYRAQMWINGQFVLTHEGGNTPFNADITAYLNGPDGAPNRVTVRVEDNAEDMAQPRGKQFWEENSRWIFYTRTTGIWQSVWLEPVERSYIERVKFTPDIDAGEVSVEYFINNYQPHFCLDIEVHYQGQRVAVDSSEVEKLPHKATRTIKLHDFDGSKQWSPEHPNLYDIVLRLTDGPNVVDHVKSYFGMRKISTENGLVHLNNAPYYMKLVLDQGYWPESLLTPPSDDALKFDIEVTKQMGFNGVRKHQKVEDPRYLYWADHMGLLVWGEMANAHSFTEASIRRLTAEWPAVIERDYNHPCIVAWVPMNESWGVPRMTSDPRQPQFTLSLYHLTHALDSTRLVISDDGWEHTKSDLCTIHDYDNATVKLQARYASRETAINSQPADRHIYVPGFEHGGEPIVVSEFGGIGCQMDATCGWGYTTANSTMQFAEAYYTVISDLMSLPLVHGYCYTQLCDVEQEINGLLTYDRKPKLPIEFIRAVNDGKTYAEALILMPTATTPAAPDHMPMKPLTADMIVDPLTGK